MSPPTHLPLGLLLPWPRGCLCSSCLALVFLPSFHFFANLQPSLHHPYLANLQPYLTNPTKPISNHHRSWNAVSLYSHHIHLHTHSLTHTFMHTHFHHCNPPHSTTHSTLHNSPIRPAPLPLPKVPYQTNFAQPCLYLHIPHTHTQPHIFTHTHFIYYYNCIHYYILSTNAPYYYYYSTSPFPALLSPDLNYPINWKIHSLICLPIQSKEPTNPLIQNNPWP